MQIVTNEQFVASKARIGKFGTLLGFGAMIAGFFASLDTERLAISYGLLIFGLLAFNVGRYHHIRWGVRPREDEVIAAALKGLDQRHLLLNYSDKAPAAHLLLSPLGLFLIETRVHDGKITCEGDRWRRKKTVATIMRSFIEGGIGNPSKEALQGVAALKSFLAESLDSDTAEAVPVETVIVFTNPRAELQVTDPVVPVVAPKDLRSHVRSAQGRTKITGDVYRRVHELLESNDAKSNLVATRERRRA